MLESLGLTASADALYERLLSEYAIPLTPGHGLDEADVSLLIESGLAVRMPEDYAGNLHGEQPRLIVVLPDEGIGRLLLAEEQRITGQRERLIKVRREFAAVRAMFESTRGESDHADLVQILAGRDEVGAAYKTVLRTAEREISLLDTAHFEAAPEQAQVTPVSAIKVHAGELSYRTIYDHSIYTEHPEYMHYMLSESRATGEV